MILPLLLALASPQVPERDWSATLREDAQALHDDIATNHPGPVNKADPGFAGLNDAALALALRRAKTARDYGDYFFALREYVSGFNDGHMSFGARGSTPNDFRWPGFFTDYDARGRIRVVVTGEGAQVPTGAELRGCDRRSADQYASATLGKMWGRWRLESQRRSHGRDLFLDEGSRYVPRARSCTFLIDGKPRTVALAWQPITIRALFDILAKLSPPTPRVFATRTLANGTRWFAMPSFNGSAQSDAGKALPPMIAAMHSDRAALETAPTIVLDLRRNDGGASDWSRQIAVILWGQAALDRLPKNGVLVDWRASPANLASIKASYASSGTGSPETQVWFKSVISGLSGAIARGQPLWRQRDDDGRRDDKSAPAASMPPPAGRVYVLTDSDCASACLDAVDLWRALGAIHIGKTTSADTLYMDIRQRTLPSGLTGVSMPMKVYRDRPRGSNQPVVPVYPFEGDISDTPALETWIASRPK